MLHDENYKRLFASKLMVEHLLRACLPDDLLAAADFSELGELSTEYVSDELRKRHGDTVWRLRLGERWVYLLILLEFQSEDDRWMALRILTYTGLLYQELVRNEAPEVADGRLPPVLPIVLYNGTEPWTAARKMSGLVAPGGPWLAPYQPAQGYFLLDLRRVAADARARPTIVPGRNLVTGCARWRRSGAEPVVRRCGREEVSAAGAGRTAALVTGSARGGVAARVRRRLAGAMRHRRRVPRPPRSLLTILTHGD